MFLFFFSSRRRHTRLQGDWSSDVCSSDLCWGAQPGFGPQQRLLLEAIAMLLPEAPPVVQGHFRQADLRRPVPEKPALPRVTLLATGTWAHHAHDRHLEVPGFGQMQAGPPSDLDRSFLSIAALPPASSLPIGAGVAALKALAIFARRSAFARGGRSRTIQHALAFEPQQFIEGQVL